MPRPNKKDAALKAELAALGEKEFVPTHALEMNAPYAGITLKFDYSLIDDEELRAATREAAFDINMRRRRAAEDIFKIGLRLLEIQAAIPKYFIMWLEVEFEYDRKTAEEYMHVARRFREEPELIANVSATVLRVLGSPSLPEEGVEAILTVAADKAEMGEMISVAEAKALANEFRAPEDKRPNRRERIARTIAGTYSVQQSDDPVVKTLLEGQAGSPELDDALYKTSKEQLRKALALLPPDDASRRNLLETSLRTYEKSHPDYDAVAANGSTFKAPAISTRKKESVIVELPRPLWGKMVEAFKQFDMNPVISDKDALRIVKTIELSLETQ